MDYSIVVMPLNCLCISFRHIIHLHNTTRQIWFIGLNFSTLLEANVQSYNDILNLSQELMITNTFKAVDPIYQFFKGLTKPAPNRPFFVPVILFVIFLFSACNSDSSGGDSSETAQAAPEVKVHVAFAGGGWRAHTGHSGWTMSLLDGGKRKLDGAFKNVGTISSNSGGSWFSTMLMYSSDFAKAIEAPNAFDTWDSTGWLGQQKRIFEKPCEGKEWFDRMRCILKHLEKDEKDVGYWDKLVEDIVFKDYPIDSTVTLDKEHLPWAKDKPLLLAATLLTNEVAINGTTKSMNFYQVCPSPSKPHWNNEDDGAYCSEGKTQYVSPVIFSSIPKAETSNIKAPPFLPQVHPDQTPLEYNIGYFNRRSQGMIYDTTTLSNPIKSDQVPVMIAAAASSAAMGFAGSVGIQKANNNISPWTLGHKFEDEALSFELRDSTAKFVDASNMQPNEMKDQKLVRIADGGPVDNSGVAQLVKFLQLNNPGDSFNIVAFDNVEEPYFPFPEFKTKPVGGDIAYLFGKDLSRNNGFCTKIPDMENFCVDVPHLKIFDDSALLKTKVTWRFPHRTDADKELIYTAYQVTTVDNSTFGITKGSKGTLHAFTCVWKGAGTGPIFPDIDSDFKAYAEMLTFIKTGLKAEQGKGLNYLEKALRLK